METNPHNESQWIDAKQDVAPYFLMMGSVNWSIALGQRDLQHIVSGMHLVVHDVHSQHVKLVPGWTNCCSHRQDSREQP
jgi:hypothetical protein